MSSTLDDLFDQIIHSERRAQERKSFLNEIKTQTTKLEEEIADIQQEYETLKGELVLKIHKLNEEEFACKLMKNREMILSDQWAELKKTKEKLTSELTDLQIQFDLKREKFCDEVKSFSSIYDLFGNGTAIREQEAQKVKKGLIEEEKCLLEAIGDIENSQKALQEKQAECDRYTEVLEDLQRQQKDKEKKLEEERKKTSELEREKERLTHIPHEDQEFVKLQKELEENKPGFLEEKCYELQKEVQILQKRLWQKQVKQRNESWKQKQLQKTSERKTQCSNSNEAQQTPHKSNRVCLTNYSTVSNLDNNAEENNKKGVGRDQNSDYEDNLSQEDLNDIFNEDMTTAQTNRQRRIFKSSSQSRN